MVEILSPDFINLVFDKFKGKDQVDLQILIIIIAFLLAYIDKITAKSDEKRKGFKKYFNLRSFALLLLIILTAFQIFDFVTQSQEEEVRGKKITETYTNVKKSQEKIDSVLTNMLIQIETTQKELELISDLNIDLKEVRKNISKSLSEYQKINLLYSEQLDLEREKILNAKPDISIFKPITLLDSISYNGQFSLINSGQRLADSIKHYSIMVLVDTVKWRLELTKLKTNISDHNTLSIPADGMFHHYINYHICLRADIEKYHMGFLIVKYSYYDLMLDKTIVSPVNIYKSTNLKEINKQYWFNVPTNEMELVKNYIKSVSPNTYSLFW